MRICVCACDQLMCFDIFIGLSAIELAKTINAHRVFCGSLKRVQWLCDISPLIMSQVCVQYVMHK